MAPLKPDKLVWILEDDEDSIFVYQQILEARYSLDLFQELAQLEKGLKRGKYAPETLPDLLIADLSLKDGNFLEFLGREETTDLIAFPFIVVSSCDDLDILRSSFEEGALDYLIKPFMKAELIVKLERKLASIRPEPRFTSRINNLVLDSSSMSISRGNDVLAQLTARELQICSVLYRAHGDPVPRKQLESEVWRNISVGTKALDVHFFNLRRKLAKIGAEIRFCPPESYVLSLSDGVDSELPIGR